MTGRLFTFGCSFTKYACPTWADILIKERNQGENWGRGAASNSYIFHAFNECNIKNKITSNDIVIIMWSTLDRESYYKNNKWITGGSFNINDLYSEEYIEKFVDDRGSMIKNYSYIFAVDQILQSIGCEYYFLSMMDLTYPRQYNFIKPNADLVKKYNFLLKKIHPSVFEIIFDRDWKNRPNIKNDLSDDRVKEYYKEQYKIFKFQYNNVKGSSWPEFNEYYFEKNLKNIDSKILNEIEFFSKKLGWDIEKKDYLRLDSHPTPLEHLEYLDKVLPEFFISDNTRNWVKSIDAKFLNNEDISQIWVNTEVKRW